MAIAVFVNQVVDRVSLLLGKSHLRLCHLFDVIMDLIAIQQATVIDIVNDPYFFYFSQKFDVHGYGSLKPRVACLCELLK